MRDDPKVATQVGRRSPTAGAGMGAPGRWGGILVVLAWMLALAAPPSRAEGTDAVPGLPLSRAYTLAEIGNIPRGARLAFDALGRIAVISDGAIVVLNDNTWIDVTEKPQGWAPMMRFIREIEGTTYYCAQGSWGSVEYSPSGRLRPAPMVPAGCPKWVPITNFDQIIPGAEGVFFSGWNGVVYRDGATGAHRFFAVPQVSRMFRVAGRVFVSSLTDGILEIDLRRDAVEPVAGDGLAGVVIEQQTELGDGRVLVATSNRQLMVFDGRRLTPWPNQLGEAARHRVSDMVHLADGGIALAIEGQGVFILSPQGDVVASLASPGYFQATGLVAREPGVLWIGTELGVEKVLYDVPVTVVDQRLGVPITWPQLVRWRGRTVIASNGHLYETDPARAAEGFKPVAGQPENGVWGLAAAEDRLLVANAFGVFAREPDGGFGLILDGIKVDRLVMVNPELCYVIGATEITALRHEHGRWAECARRVPGVGYPALVCASRTSAWIELGPNRAARVVLRDGTLKTEVFEHFPWEESPWIHISAHGDIVVLSGPPLGQVFFDETRDEMVDAPELQRIFREAPYRIARIRQDAAGTFWASHEQGVFRIVPSGDGFVYDPTSLDIIRDRVPVVWVLGGTDVWFSTGYSLYHVNRAPAFAGRPAVVKPRLVSVLDDRSRREIFGAMHDSGSIPRLEFAQNSLTLRFFAGTYAALRSPGYQFRMNGRVILAAGSDLTLPDLREGTYRLEVRLTDARGPLGEPLLVTFIIDPPWYRTWYSVSVAVAAGAVLLLWTMRWSLRRSRRRNLALEKLVQERTEELRSAMQRLEAETRNAATLAERNRLAGEIHDSLQQGLSGLILQLDATLKLSGVPKEVHSRLSVARNMVSFTRHEVQNAVWNLESPLLENQDLGEALRKMAGLIGSGSPRIDIEISGPPRRLSSSAKHHLLRIAQEAITNAVRHGGASRIIVALHYDGDAVTLLVKDDGRGFVPQQVLTREFGHFGLRGLRGRADKINGDLEIVSEPGQGASVTIRVPTG